MTPELRSRLLAAMPGLKERAKTLVELIDSAGFLSPTARLRSTTRPGGDDRRGPRADDRLVDVGAATPRPG